MEAQGYYPFGLLLPGRHEPGDLDNYRFAFNGQETDKDINGETGTSYAFENRIHDPRIARFWSIDPLAEAIPHYSPYVFAGNKPIAAIDSKGNIEVVVHFYTITLGGSITHFAMTTNVKTIDDLKGVHRETLHVNYYRQEVGVQDGNRSWTELKTVGHALVAGTGETEMERMKRTNALNYYPMRFWGGFVLLTPVGQIGKAFLKKEPFTGEDRSELDQTIDFASGIVGAVTFGLASGSSEAFSMYMKEQARDVAAEGVFEILGDISEEQFGFNASQTLSFFYTIRKLAREGREDDLKQMRTWILAYWELGLKGGELLEQLRKDHGYNMDLPENNERGSRESNSGVRRQMSSRINITRDNRTLSIVKSRRIRFLTLMIGLSSIGGAVLVPLGFYFARHRHLDFLEVSGLILFMIACIISAILRANDLIFDRNIVLVVGENSIRLNNYSISFSNLREILVVQKATRFGDWTYKVALVDMHGQPCFLASFVGKDKIDLITSFILEFIKLPKRIERSSSVYRFKDLTWDMGLWKRVA